MSSPRTIYLVPATRVVEARVPPAHHVPPSSKRRLEDILEEPRSVVPRKRERLTHLSADEKLNRRKLKNRVAAQNARDRKKMRSNQLEDVVARLLEENEKLVAENRRLGERVGALEKKLSEKEKTALGSAASISAPLQRDQALDLQEIMQELEADDGFDLAALCDEVLGPTAEPCAAGAAHEQARPAASQTPSSETAGFESALTPPSFGLDCDSPLPIDDFCLSPSSSKESPSPSHDAWLTPYPPFKEEPNFHYTTYDYYIE